MTEHPSSRTQGPDGRIVASPDTAERDADMARMRSRGASYRAIAAQFGLSVSTAHEAVQRALNAIRSEAGEAAREMELRRLDDMVARIEQVLEREHVTISHGRVMRRRVTDDDGRWIPILDHNGDPLLDSQDRVVYREEEIPDDGPVFQAIDRLLKISQRRAALLGLDAPVKAEVGGTITYEIVGFNPDDL